MDFLQPFAEGETVRAIAGAAFQSGQVHGVALELDPVWAWAETARWFLDEDELQAGARELRFWTDRRRRLGGFHGIEIDIYSSVSPARVDISWSPSWWADLVEEAGQPQGPVVIVVSILPDRFAQASEIRGQLRELAGPSFRVELRAMPVPTLYGSAVLAHDKVRCGPRTGTTGGVLEVKGKHLLAASAHVCPSGQPVTVGGATGVCTASESLKILNNIPVYDDFDDAPCTDIALLSFPHDDLARAPLARGLAQPAPSGVLRQGMPLQPLVPRKPRTLMMAQYSVAQCFRVDGLQIGGTWALYRDLFTMRRRSECWYDRAFEVGATIGGDSGAWVVRQGHGVEWVGSIVGGEAPFSYGAFARGSLEQADATVVPPDDLPAIAS